MILKIGWRNIWRNRSRTLVVIGAVVFGVWGLIFLLGFSYGFVNSYLENAISSQISHIQIHNPNYLEDPDINYTLGNIEKIELALNQQAVDNWSKRSLLSAMISSSHANRSCFVIGVAPESEDKLTLLSSKILEGDYFEEKGKNQIIISKRLANKLQCKLRSKIVLTFQKQDGELGSASFRVKGLYSSQNNQLDDMNIYIKSSDLQRESSMSESTFHEVAILLDDLDKIDEVKANLENALPNLIVRDYKEISPDLDLYQSQIQMSVIIMTTIFMLALIFGIINTMLMSVLERVRELGMLMAVGMNKFKVFVMVVLETLFLSILGAPIGILLGMATISWLGRRGIDLSAWAEGLNEFGMAKIVYPFLQTSTYFTIGIAVIITAIVGSIYPAIKAVRMRPVQALRKI